MVDAITLSVLRGRLEEICDEMDATLFRTAFSHVIAEARDASHGLYHPENGSTLVQGKMALPVFVGSMSFAVKGVIDRFGGEFADGDVYFLNDPYLGGTHVNDAKLVKPLFHDGQLICCLASTGHWNDLGGNVPGNMNPSAIEVFQEGLRIPPMKLIDKGSMRDDVLDLVMANSRIPLGCYGDLHGQLNAIELGTARVKELLDEYGVETLQQGFAELTSRAASMTGSLIAELPDGTYSAEDFLDNDGVNDKPIRIAVDMTIKGDRMTLDFSRTSQPCAGPLNICYASAVAAGYIAIKHTFPEVPANAGCLQPVEFIIPEDSLLRAEPPRPTGGYTDTVARVIDVIFAAMAKASARNAMATPFGTVNTTVIGGTRDDGRKWVMLTFFGGGHGGNWFADGLNNGNTPFGMATNNPVEIIEAAFPVMYTQWALRPDSGGPGRHRGGLGVIIEFELLEGHGLLSVFGDRARAQPGGAVNGLPGKTNRVLVGKAGDQRELAFGAKVAGMKIHHGQRVRLETPGGGGFGPPSERDPEMIRRDIRLGYVSRQAAEAAYGSHVTLEESNARVKGEVA